MKTEKQAFQKDLVEWYRRSSRGLPWRTTKDPYRIWVAETLLQQTRVQTAVDYYARFLERFPTLSVLAEAPLEAVLLVWEGLGYYSRARNLHRAARALVAERNGTIPSDPETLKALPGVGPYTACAIASMAFDRPVAVVDGNVSRVLCRVYAIDQDPKDARTRKHLQALADRLVPKRDPSSFNQALMELGALICTPTRPRCAVCPLGRICIARERDLILKLPVRRPGKVLPVRTRVVAAVEHRGRILFTQRPLDGLTGGLWEIPGTYLEEQECTEEGRLRLEKSLAWIVVLRGAYRTPLPPLTHRYTHFLESLLVSMYTGVTTMNGRGRQREQPRKYRWLYPSRLRSYPITGATRKILDAYRQAKAETHRQHFRG